MSKLRMHHVDEYSSRQLRSLLEGMEAVRKGNLTMRIQKERDDIFGELADSYNGMVTLVSGLAEEVSRVAAVAGEKGKLDTRASVQGASGSWKGVIDTLNSLIDAIQTPIKEVQRVLSAISKGDLTTKIAMDTATGDFKIMADTVNKTVDDLNRLAGEVSRVAAVAGTEGKLSERAKVEGVAGSWKAIVDTLNGLIEAIATPMMEVQRVLVAMSEGDLSQKVSLEKAAGDFKAIGDTINLTVRDLGGLIKKVGDVTENVMEGSDLVASASSQVNTALRQVADIVKQVSEGAQGQSKRLEETTKVVAVLSNSIQQGATNARSTAETTLQAAQLAAKGTESGKDAGVRLKSIDTIVRTNSDTVRKVDETSQEVTAITGTINDIADQTNLLALNAAIEAARAGEAGRGFAVVADEVRKLAERAKKATNEIEGLIGNVRKAASSAVNGMTQGAEQIGESIKIVDNALSVLDQIGVGTQEITVKSQEISDATEEQSASTQQVAKTIDEIASISEQNAASSLKMSTSVQQQIVAMEQMASSAQELSGLAKELGESIKQFKLSSEEAAAKKEAERVSVEKVKAKRK